MNKPKVGKVYIFVRPHGDALEHTEFVREADGSAGFAYGGAYQIHENRPDAWRDALADLTRLGFLELNEARETGLAPPDWQPTPDTYVLKQGQVALVREA